MKFLQQGAIALTAVVGMLGFARTASADLEEPDFDVIETRDGFEIRRYAPYIVAETTVTGTAREAGNSGFRILAGYIFGDNTTSTRMEMTTPVTTRGDGTKMKMTAPVTMKQGAKGSHTMRFVMERKYTLETLPKPNDSRISLIEIPERTVAVLRYSGRTTDTLFATKRARLLAGLRDAGIKPLAQPVKAVFNGPWTPAFMRRNEVQVEVQWPPSAAAR